MRDRLTATRITPLRIHVVVGLAIVAMIVAALAGQCRRSFQGRALRERWPRS